jgi:hypothetical protein
MKKVSRKNNHYQGAKIYKSIDEKFLIEMRQLVRTIQATAFLDDDEITYAINNALIQFIKGVKRKGIDTSEYNNYKGYMYIILSNEVKKLNVMVNLTRKAKDNKNDYIAESDTSFYGSDDEIETYDYMQAIRDILSDEEYYVATELIYGFDQKQIKKDFDNSKFKVGKIVERIRKKIFPHMKFRMRQFETRSDVHNTKRQPYIKPEINYDLPDFYAE